MAEESIPKPRKFKTVARPGYLGSKRGLMEASWDNQYGPGMWRIAWETANGSPLTFEEIFEEYIQGYTAHFTKFPQIVEYLTTHASFAYDIDSNITRKQAFDPNALVGIPGVPNQFHHVAINIAITERLGQTFTGITPIQVRGLKRSIPLEEWPITSRLQPGFIQCTHPELIRQPETPIWWIRPDSVEGLYQYCKVLQTLTD